MKLLFLFIILGLSIGATALFNIFRKKQKRQEILNAPFPKEWENILQKNLPPYSSLSQNLRNQLQDKIRIFIAEKSFEGCSGITMTDEIKVTIAAQACMLILNRKAECYPKLYSILVYPSTYVAGANTILGGQPEEVSARLGESWNTGAVVLAWDSVKHGAANFNDGHNVTMHEFAHQLDQEYRASDGAPILENRSAYATWGRVFSKEYEQLRSKTAHGKKSVMYDYGATNPAEFFAVATETFFEKPRQLKKKHPELYEELNNFYKVDPIEWE